MSNPLLSPAGDGLLLARSVLLQPHLQALATGIDAVFQKLGHAQPEERAPFLSGIFASGQKFAPTASSVTVGAVLSNEHLLALLRDIAGSWAGDWIRCQLGGNVAADLDQAWLRRQYAPEHYPPFHRPHGWHQDGALGFDFLAHGQTLPGDALLPMVTLWIALDPCGVEAPGLELITRRISGLLPPTQLNGQDLQAQFSPAEFWRPILEPGDGLLFLGDILHRTHVTPGMTRDRHSLEFRFFRSNQLPSRLQGDSFLSVDETYGPPG